MSTLVTIAISLGGLALGGLGGWWIKQIKSTATQGNELAHLKDQIEALKATPKATPQNVNGLTPHQQLKQQIASLRSVINETAHQISEIHQLQKEWEKHRWPPMIEALKDSAEGSHDAAQATELLVSLIKSGALAGGKNEPPRGSGG